MDTIRNIVRTVLSESDMSQHWFEASIVSQMKALGFIGEGKHIDENNITHFIFVKEHKNEAVFSAVITQGTHGFMLKLKAYDPSSDKRDTIFNGIMKKTSELSNISDMIIGYLDDVKLRNLGVSRKSKALSKSDIEAMIDNALDKKDYKEAERLSKML